MNYTADQLKPSNPVILIDGMEVELSLLTLSKTVKLQELYGELHLMYEKIAKDASMLLDIFWHLVIRKEMFDYRISTFKLSIQSKPLKDLGAELIEIFNTIVVNSMPLVINKKRMDDINKLKKATDDGKPCYAKYYDALAKRYGITLNEFYELTLRQITAHLETINDEAYSELEVQASLAGKKLKPRIVYNQVTEEEEKEQEKEALDAVARLQKEYEERQKNKEVNNGK